MKLAGEYRLLVEGDTGKVGVGYDHRAIGYLFQRLLTGEEANMENLANLGITVTVLGEDDDGSEFVAIRRETMD